MTKLAEEKRLEAARKIAAHVAETVDAKFSLRLWDGSQVPLGRDPEPGFFLSISGPGVIGSLLRAPTLENLLNHYAVGHIDFHGGDMMAFGDVLRKKSREKKHRRIRKGLLFKEALPLLMTSSRRVTVSHRYDKDELGRNAAARNNSEFIRFHYDAGNEFYQLFLDPEMQYSCGYFRAPDESLEQAQLNKLEMICRKLRLRPDETLLDVGCGWGGLICYAAQHYGVRAHGVTLSKNQYDFTLSKVRRLGLEDRVTVELRDYSTVEGTFDKIASIGMYEHVGIKQYPRYFRKLHGLLREGGILLNHGICRRAKRSSRQFNKIRPGRRWILKHIFPGSELDHIGHTIESMEARQFEVHDVEAWREHYARTARFWCERLCAREKEAAAQVGREKYRLWIAYLAGVAFSFADGPLCVYQVVATRRRKGASGMPLTREDLYAEKQSEEPALS